MARSRSRKSSPKSQAETPNKPVLKVQYGTISAAVFEQLRQLEDGTRTDFSINLQRSYRDKEGNWQNNSISFFRREALIAAQALMQAFHESYEHQKSAANHEGNDSDEF